MAKKKKIEEIDAAVQQIQPVEVVPQILPDTATMESATIKPDKPEPLLTVTVSEDFKDGALAERFKVLGYPVLWKKGESRSIPMTLFVRCKRSGAKFEL